MAKATLLALLGAALLEGGGGAEGGVEGDVVGLAVGGAGLDVAAALALGVGARAAPGVLAGQLVERGVELARVEGLADLDLLAAVPPVGVLVVENRLLRRGLGGRAVAPVIPRSADSVIDFFFTESAVLGFFRGFGRVRLRWMRLRAARCAPAAARG